MAVKPNLALIPSGVKASKVYSVLPSDGVGDFDFSRSGSATRINKDGLIETVASNVPRLNYPLIDGVVSGCPSLLLETQRINLIPYSNFDNGWELSNATRTLNSSTSPDGSLNAVNFKSNTSSSNEKYIRRFLGVSASTDYTFSVFAKKKELSEIRLGSTGNSNAFAFFNLSNGVIESFGSAATAEIQNFGNGWYRCSIKHQNSITSIFSVINLSINGSVNISTNINDGVYLFGSQYEQGSFPTSYIPTSGATATRSAETCNNSGDANTFNDSEGVLMIETSLLDNSLPFKRISISDGGSLSKRIAIGGTSTTNQLQALIIDSTIQVNIFSLINNIEANNKIAFKYKTSDFALWVNGFELATETAGTIPTGLDVLNFDEADGTSEYFGNTKQIQYFDTALTDTDLEELTSWTSFNEMAESQLYSIQ